MAVEQVELRRDHLLAIAHQHVPATAGKGAGVDALLGEKAPGMLAEVVVHRRIEHIAVQPVPGGLPYLAHQQAIGLDRLDAAANARYNFSERR